MVVPMQAQGQDTRTVAIGLLEKYCERREEFRQFDEYDAVMAQARAVVAHKVDLLREPLKGIAARLFNIQDQGFFLLQVCEWKIAYIADALIHAINTGNSLALANNTRALIEHLGGLVAVARQLDRLGRELRGKNNERAIKQLLERTETFIHRAYYGKSPKTTKTKAEQALHVESDLLAALRDDVENIDEVYAFLCDYVHPNYGSNALVSTGRLAGGRLNPSPEYHRETTDRLLRCCAYAMSYLEVHGIEWAGTPVRLQFVLDLCFVEHATLGNAFATKAPIPKGDGKTKDSAYWFPKARTKPEAVELCYEFLAQRGDTIVSRRVRAIEGGSVYHMFTTDNGQFWFKFTN